MSTPLPFRQQGAATDLSSELAEIIEHARIQTIFQPILDPVGRGILGYEALSRGPSTSRLHSPLELFAAALRANCTVALEECCLGRAIQRFRTASLQGRLFLNISPFTLLAAQSLPTRLSNLLAKLGLPANRCVLEITEQSLVDDYAAVRRALDALREIGCEIAVDDLGAGYSGLKTWSELRPDYVKIDRYFVSDIHADGVKAEILRSIVEMSRAIGSRVVAEGVETAEECTELLDIGVDYLQGYYFGRPQAEPRVNDAAMAHLAGRGTTVTAVCAEELVLRIPPIEPETRVQDVVAMFRAHLDWDSLAVVRDGRPLGIVRRDDLFQFLTKPLHPEVYNRKPVTSVMESPPLLIDSRLRLEQVGRLVTRRSRPKVNDDFIITRDGRYAGIGKIIDVLRQITAQQIQAAKDSNPLTLLPGNAQINTHIERMLSQRRQFVVCHLDVDHFKPYNDQYGYARGDQFLLQLAQMIRNAICGRSDFVGHLGGDDFIAVMRSQDWKARVLALVENFSGAVPSLYAAEHREADGIRAVDRDGVLRTYPLATLSVAALEIDADRRMDANAIADELRRVKALAKAQRGSSFLLSTGEEVIDLQLAPA
ncbi:MAG TPA: bifunctional diguanylate cyclase/phosphodiesterase [Steroidobacteraceae bacterium]|nr:bifunctional diguanylate cyclase/phosphodiesterase [Steroidobacteraceae bacterium]